MRLSMVRSSVWGAVLTLVVAGGLSAQPVQVIKIGLKMTDKKCDTKPVVDPPGEIEVYLGQIVVWAITNGCDDKPERKVALTNFKKQPSGQSENPFEDCNLERKKIKKGTTRYVTCMAEVPEQDTRYKYDIKGTDILDDPLIVIRRPTINCDRCKVDCPPPPSATKEQKAFCDDCRKQCPLQ